MTTHFLTPLLTEFTDRLNEAVANAQAEILATLAGVTSSTKPAPSSPPVAGAKRTPAELARMTELVFNIIKSYPGQGIELLAEKCGLTTREMSLPIKKLRADKRVTTKGAKRSMVYMVTVRK